MDGQHCGDQRQREFAPGSVMANGVDRDDADRGSGDEVELHG
jgi:hypothetical protein